MDTLQAMEKLNILIAKERASKQNIHRTIVFDHKHMTVEEFLALSKIIIENLVPGPVFTVPNQYAEFQKAAIQGEIDILQMTKRQQMYFLLFLQDKNLQSETIWAAADAEEKLSAMRKFLPDMVAILENPELEDEKIFHKATIFVGLYLKFNRKVLTYQKYLELYKVLYLQEA